LRRSRKGKRLEGGKIDAEKGESTRRRGNRRGEGEVDEEEQGRDDEDSEKVEKGRDEEEG